MAGIQASWLSLRSNELSAEIDPRGAQLSTFRDRSGNDLLWGGDPAIWAGRAPLLFPIVGALAGGSYRLGSRTYPLPRHGFARGKMFEVIESTPEAATCVLRHDADTLLVYPFLFELQARFALQDQTLSVALTVRNHGDAAMPASMGFHPGFRWPLPYGYPRSSHFIEFAADEPAPVRRLDADGLLTPRRHPTPIAARRLALTDDLFQNDAIIFDQMRSRWACYGAEQGPRLRIEYPDAPYLGIWAKPHADFVCLEPWHGVADLEGFDGDFTAKTGVFMVAAGAAKTMEVRITLVPG